LPRTRFTVDAPYFSPGFDEKGGEEIKGHPERIALLPSGVFMNQPYPCAPCASVVGFLSLVTAAHSTTPANRHAGIRPPHARLIRRLRFRGACPGHEYRRKSRMNSVT